MNSDPYRRWFTFSLRTLLGIVTVAAVILGLSRIPGVLELAAMLTLLAAIFIHLATVARL